MCNRLYVPNLSSCKSTAPILLLLASLSRINSTFVSKCVKNSSDVSFLAFFSSIPFFSLSSKVYLVGHTNHIYYLYTLDNNLLSPKTLVILQSLSGRHIPNYTKSFQVRSSTLYIDKLPQVFNFWHVKFAFMHAEFETKFTNFFKHLFHV